MFQKVGKKMKMLAKVVTIIGCIASVLFALGLAAAAESPLVFFLVAPVGIAMAWLQTLVFYALGDLVDNAERIRELLEEQ